MIRQNPFNHSEYYRYLSGGYRLPLVGGTDKMSSDVPVGLYRTYARLDGEFTYDNWCRAVAAGRTFLSGGPIIHLSVDGQEIGDTVRLSGAGTVEVEAWAESILPVHTLQIVQAGRIVESSESAGGSRRLAVKTRLKGGRPYLDSGAVRRPGLRRDGPSRRLAARHVRPYVAHLRRGWGRLGHVRPGHVPVHADAHRGRPCIHPRELRPAQARQRNAPITARTTIWPTWSARSSRPRRLSTSGCVGWAWRNLSDYGAGKSAAMVRPSDGKRRPPRSRCVRALRLPTLPTLSHANPRPYAPPRGRTSSGCP